VEVISPETLATVEAEAVDNTMLLAQELEVRELQGHLDKDMTAVLGLLLLLAEVAVVVLLRQGQMVPQVLVAAMAGQDKRQQLQVRL
jgi:hypothetical protein